MDFSITRASDSYKFTHHEQYPPGTEHVYSYLESRRLPNGWTDDVVFFGLQYFLQAYLAGEQIFENDIENSARMAAAHFGNAALYNRAGWLHILEKHDGRLPVSIRAVPEGTVLGTRNVLMTIENTDPECEWLTNWLETLLVQPWSMCTVATHSRQCKRIIRDALERSGDPSLLPFKLHDFGFRGVSSVETAATAGAAHLVNFKGTDTFVALDLIRDHYHCEMAGFSIPAAEHSTITSWGREGEADAYANMLAKFPTGLVAVVSDSYDIFHACREIWGRQLREQVLARDGTLVIRPDSGELPETPVRVIATLGEAFGYTMNAKGYKVLPPQVRVIQGDGIDKDAITEILDLLMVTGWSADNIAFGSGGGLLQKFNRDTLGFAMKCSDVTINGVHRDVYKEPVTDRGKNSKRGRLKLIRESNGTLSTVRQDAVGDDQLTEVFRDGEVLVEHTFDQIRERAELR